MLVRQSITSRAKPNARAGSTPIRPNSAARVAGELRFRIDPAPLAFDRHIDRGLADNDPMARPAKWPCTAPQLKDGLPDRSVRRRLHGGAVAHVAGNRRRAASRSRQPGDQERQQAQRPQHDQKSKAPLASEPPVSDTDRRNPRRH